MANLARSHMSASAAQSEDEDEVSASQSEGEDSISEVGSTCTMTVVSACRSYAAMGLYPTCPTLRIDGIMLDTGCNYFSTIGEKLIHSAILASVRKTKPEYGNLKSIGGLGGHKLTTRGTMPFSFLFGGHLYTLTLHTVNGSDPMLMSHADMDRFGFNYQSGIKVLQRISDSYEAPVEMRNGLPFLLFEATGFFTSSQLRAMHRNLGHPSVEKQMRTIELAEIKDLPKKTREKIKEIHKHCRACK